MLNRMTMKRTRQRGLSLVELMVGIAVGLFVLAAAAAMTATQLSDNRRLLLETQVQQDLRMAADIIARDLRRAGYAGGQWVNAIWPSAGTSSGGSQPNTFDTFAVGADGDSVEFDYNGDGGGPVEAGYRLQGTRLQSDLGTGGWQDLTDASTLEITAFTVQSDPVEVTSGPVPDKLPCPRLCPDTTTNCWPELVVRDVRITIVGRAVSDAAVQHTVTRSVRLRNDQINFLAAGGASICPL